MKVIALVGEQVSPIFYLSGMEVLSPKNHEELLNAFNKCINRHDIGLLVISARYAMALSKEIEEVRFSGRDLAILEISSSQGNYNAGEKLMKYVKDAIGLS